MTTTAVKCSKSGCDADATQKIAAPWKDGRFSELKTYGFACPAHAPDVLAAARARSEAHTPAPGEVIGAVECYPL